MKIIRYVDPEGNIHYGCQAGQESAVRIAGDIFGDYTITGETAAVARLLAPVAARQILCIGRNYLKHAAESGAGAPERPVLFIKNINALNAPDAPIEIPTHLASHEVDYEGELAVIIGRDCKNVSREDALNYVLGYTCSNDVSARDHQKKWGGGQWCRGKSFDTFAPLGPHLITTDGIADPNQLRIRTYLNGTVVQDANTCEMIFDVPALIAYLSGSTTLVAGTVILTGTPEGVGMAAQPSPRWLRPGDEVVVEIEGIGALRNPVRLENQ